VGDIIVADSVFDPASGSRFQAEQPTAETGVRAIHGPVLSLDRVAVTAGEKDRLRMTGAVAVDMETAVVAARAREARIPFYCVRVVSDGAGESLAMDFNQYRDREGRFSRWRIAAAALRAPRSIPALRRLDRNCRLAAGRLGEFLADCRF
jgi:adenosylhomocysteine nucleosidase